MAAVVAQKEVAHPVAAAAVLGVTPVRVVKAAVDHVLAQQQMAMAVVALAANKVTPAVVAVVA